MSKIDIAIKLASGIDKDPIVSAPGDWVSSVRDIRDVFSHISGYEGKVVTMISFCRTGTLVTLFRALDGRAGDNIAAWLHVPCESRISGSELLQLIGGVKNLLFNSSIEVSQLQELTSKEYPDKPYKVNFMASKRIGHYAFRRTDTFPMSELLGENRYQEYYKEFDGVFILDSTDTVSPVFGISDLSRYPLFKYAYLLPPDKTLLENSLGKGTTLHHKKGPFTSALSVKKGETIALYAQRPGLDKVEIPVTINEEFQRLDLQQGLPLVWKKTISKDQVLVLDPDGKEVLGAKISINNQNLGPNGVTLDESQIGSVLVGVRASGYRNQEKEYSFAGSEKLRITLEKDAETETPLKLIQKLDKKSFLIGAACGGVLVAVIAILIALASPKRPTEPVIDTPVEPETPVVEAPADTVAAEPPVVIVEENPQGPTPEQRQAIQFLDTHPVWIKQDIEAVPALKGLFQALNKSDFTTVKRILGPLEEYSRQAKKIMDAINGADRLPGGTYLPDGDEEITIDRYLQKKLGVGK